MHLPLPLLFLILPHTTFAAPIPTSPIPTTHLLHARAYLGEAAAKAPLNVESATSSNTVINAARPRPAPERIDAMTPEPITLADGAVAEEAARDKPKTSGAATGEKNTADTKSQTPPPVLGIPVTGEVVGIPVPMDNMRLGVPVDWGRASL